MWRNGFIERKLAVVNRKARADDFAVETKLPHPGPAKDLVQGGPIAIHGTDDPALIDRLMPQDYPARPEQAILFEVLAWDVNCPQHIPQKLDAGEVALATQQLNARIAELEAENAALRSAQQGNLT